MQNTTQPRSYSFTNIFIFTFCIFQFIFPLMVTCQQLQLMMSCDFLMNFYPAGKLVVEKRTSELYHLATNISFNQSAFNGFVHGLLPDLPKEKTAIFMYSPLTALVFGPISQLPPQIALGLWQIASILAFAISVYLVCLSPEQNFKRSFGLGMLSLAVFQTVLIGQLGLVLGVLPLAIGYYFLTRKQLFLAGLFWSLIILKPQFLPIPMLVAGALFLNKKFACSLGFISGIVALTLTTICIFDTSLLGQWLTSFKTSDTIFSNPNYSYPQYLIISLPAAVLHLFPVSARSFIKIPAYFFSLLFSLHALWFSSRLIKKSCDNTEMSSVFVIGIALLPLILPHFLFYDFSVFALFAALFAGSIWQKNQVTRLNLINYFYLISIDIYYILLSTPAHTILQPLVLVFIMAFLYYRLLRTIALGHRAQREITPNEIT